MQLAACGEPELPAVCDEPGPLVMTGNVAEVCDHCGGDCIEMCAFYCGAGGRVSATQTPAEFCDPDNAFCGRWVE